MQNSIGTVAPTTDLPAGQSPAQRRPESAAAEHPPVDDVMDLRLIIEEDKASGSYVYKTINRATGEVVLQLPRDQILRLRDAVSYAAGQVIRAKA